MPIASKIVDYIDRASWIRAMFELGAKLKAQVGEENVFDFSLGNPNLEPPEQFFKVARELIAKHTPGDHAYMPNGGFPAVREKVARHLEKLHGQRFGFEDVLMTVGAAGAINIALKTITNPGDEVLVPAPLFMEYNFYIENHGGRMVTAPTNADFSLNIQALAEAINEKTAAVLINNPHNPTGAVYSQEQINALGQMLAEKSRQVGRVIYLIGDEPYRQIIFDGLSVPSLFQAYVNSMVVTSFSKSLSLPGERIGYVAVHPELTDKGQVVAGMTLCNRILGFVNAPALQQRIVAELLDCQADMSQYAKKRDLVCQVLDYAGFTYTRPGGSFYVYPASPIADDVAFVRAAQEEYILVVPGVGFMGPGHFRIAFCCSDQSIERSAPAFKRLRQRF